MFTTLQTLFHPQKRFVPEIGIVTNFSSSHEQRTIKKRNFVPQKEIKRIFDTELWNYPKTR